MRWMIATFPPQKKRKKISSLLVFVFSCSMPDDVRVGVHKWLPNSLTQDDAGHPLEDIPGMNLVAIDVKTGKIVSSPKACDVSTLSLPPSVCRILFSPILIHTLLAAAAACVTCSPSSPQQFPDCSWNLEYLNQD